MKTPAVSEAQRHLNRLEAEARDDYQKAAYAFKIDKEVIKITRAAIGEKIKKAVKDGNNIDYARSELEPCKSMNRNAGDFRHRMAPWRRSANC